MAPPPPRLALILLVAAACGHRAERSPPSVPGVPDGASGGGAAGESGRGPSGGAAGDSGGGSLDAGAPADAASPGGPAQDGGAVVGACGPLRGSPVGAPLFVPPDPGSITATNQMVKALAFDGAPLAMVQGALDAARAASADAMITLELKGTITVSDQPLRLPSRTALLMVGSLVAAPGATAPSLVAVENATLVGIAGPGALDAGGRVAAALSVKGSAHVHVDGIRLAGATMDNLRFTGRGALAFDQGSSITRVDSGGAGGSGISVAESTQMVLLDNYAHDNRGAGISVTSAHGVTAHNRLRQNGTGLVVGGGYGVVYRNIVDCNGLGVSVDPASNDLLVTQNELAGNQKDVVLAGSRNTLYDNTLPVGIGGATLGNFVFPNRGPVVAADAAMGFVFLPPTSGNRHPDPVVPGRPRADVPVAGGGDLAAAIAGAHADHPGAVVVVTAHGDFSLGSAVTLPDDTVLLLDGTVRLTSGAAGFRGTTSTRVAISGGTIDCGGTASNALSLTSPQGVLVEGVRMTNCAADDVHILRGSGAPTIFHRDVVVKSPRRCIWQQLAKASRIVFMDNETTGCTADGIDLDSHSNFTVCLGNNSHDNKRYGIFWEEGGTLNVGVANVIRGNGIGINVYANVGTPTNQNLAVANQIEGGRIGLRAGALPMKATDSNYFFGNQVSGSGAGIQQDGQVQNNYFSQNRLLGATRAAVDDQVGNIVLFNPPTR